MANRIYKNPLEQARADFQYSEDDAKKFKDAGFDVASEEETRKIFGGSPDYPALFKLKKNYGDVLDTPSGRRYRIEEPSDKEGLKTWGKDHILLREINDKDEDVFDFGSHGWFPIGEFLKGGK